ncbi:MAG: DEAD/DEAH box helicase [Planctomycetes bacterium]|nr:DEAD/DEAH box helicase [Planctomycetota bacterium]
MTRPGNASERRADPRAGGERRARTALSGAETSIDAMVERLRGSAELRASFTTWHETPPRPARTADFPAGLAPELVALFKKRGMTEIYAHQARAIELALAGKDVLVATPTASGKTLAYSAPVLQSLLETEGASRSLWLFPTKALSQDQSGGLNELIEELGRGWHSFTYDGDTPPSVRRTLRERGHVVLTNPYMLHKGILPNHAKWSDLFAALRYVVIDEVHTLNGVFGASVANVLRRLIRIAHHYGAEPRFLLSSATVREPAEHGRALLGREVEIVSEDASPSARRIFAVYDPPIVNAVAGLRANALEEVRRLAPFVCGPAHQTIFFCNRRTSVEVLTRYLKEAAPNLGLDEKEIRGYRGGYLPELRREIEAGLKDGTVKVVVSTNALELGIDIGRLDVAVLVGYPGSQASFWQRVGRVGRRGRTSLALLVARADPVDQYLAHHPDYLFGAARERLALDADNLVLLSEQLKCAAFELPFHAGPDGAVRDFGASPHVGGILDYLAEESKLLLRRNAPAGTSGAPARTTWYWAADAYPAQDVSLAGREADNVLIFDEEEQAIGEIDRAGSLTAVHEGAIYQVEGETYKIERFDYANRRAYARRVASDYFTEAETDTEVRVLRLEEKAERVNAAGLSDVQLWRGEVHVTTLATMYKKIRFYTRENVGAGDIHLPAEEMDTEAFVLTLAPEAAEALALLTGNRAAAWAGVGRLLRRSAPLFVRCGAGDLGISCETRSGHFERPAIFLYDRVPGGVGLPVALFRAQREIVSAAREVLARCACALGCPACVGPLEEVGPLGKETALAILAFLDEGPDYVPAALPPEPSA